MSMVVRQHDQTTISRSQPPLNQKFYTHIPAINPLCFPR